jgi:hypothetical protein
LEVKTYYQHFCFQNFGKEIILNLFVSFFVFFFKKNQQSLSQIIKTTIKKKKKKLKQPVRKYVFVFQNLKMKIENENHK